MALCVSKSSSNRHIPIDVRFTSNATIHTFRCIEHWTELWLLPVRSFCYLSALMVCSIDTNSPMFASATMATPITIQFNGRAGWLHQDDVPHSVGYTHNMYVQNAINNSQFYFCWISCINSSREFEATRPTCAWLTQTNKLIIQFK